MHAEHHFWALIPAAGSGSRMSLDIPKQYIKLHDKTVIEHSLDCFIRRADIKGVVVVIAKDDPHWPRLDIAAEANIITAPGGAERYQSVLNGLDALAQVADANDWVLVHDAARPCLGQTDIDRLIHAASANGVGGVLAVPVTDTIKRTDGKGAITATVDRDHLWRALTPQMFQLQLLSDAINAAVENNSSITDEAMAMELRGHVPLLVEGQANNIKITRNSDLLLANMYLKLSRENV